MSKKYHVRLSENEKQDINKIINSDKISKIIRKRANVLLQLDETIGKPLKQTEIAERCGVSDVTVFHVISDYCNYGLEYTLAYKRSKPNNQPIVTGEAEARIIALACGEAPKGFSRWTIRLLTEKIVTLNILETVSRETVRTTLKKHNLNLI